ncbi:Flp family type IVb pilin [Mesorhizobium sp. M7A.F.Ca.MR.245.00.0.0]|uniref:Flp family type IVb pilin n=1 Tax=unclassified Mesorhizobium TaxID=325217 RepID=UPI000FCA835A|nr:Flp family type IVb pilin [Mesorhizobium sp. M7A.F.Ca.MR.245.00.0.0]RUV19297.1 Flp family type IVb pilin [Mesorhizobium sp. M7A.F.Ca.MR.245.00.0.0]RUV50885.1 Flp family type IVb pilin [Mesorhizobium sp. M7A.F.Ca.MR.228.00.0.0]
MKKLMTMTRQFRDDENGAAMVEYSILVGIIAAASLLAILAIGGWVGAQFTGLCANLDGSGVSATGSGTGACSP